MLKGIFKSYSKDKARVEELKEYAVLTALIVLMMVFAVLILQERRIIAYYYTSNPQLPH